MTLAVIMAATRDAKDSVMETLTVTVIAVLRTRIWMKTTAVSVRRCIEGRTATNDSSRITAGEIIAALSAAEPACTKRNSPCTPALRVNLATCSSNIPISASGIRRLGDMHHGTIGNASQQRR
jgi:hypothetical protein